MEENWNRVVKPGDKVYHLGDITMGTSAKSLEILGRLNGTKVLVKGNHDLHKLSMYEKYFKDVRGSHQLAGMLLTHIPVHVASLARWGFNVHGHLHSNVVMSGAHMDPRYLCVSVEQVNFTPIPLETVVKSFSDRKTAYPEFFNTYSKH